MSNILLFLTVITAALLTQGCDEFRTHEPISKAHLQAPKPVANKDIPEPVRFSPTLPQPDPFVFEPTHTVVVHDVPVKELLFSLARDSNVNLDINSDLEGITVTINAVDQTLAAILDRVAESSGLRYELSNNVLKIQKDEPFFRNYRIDYLNIARSSKSAVRIATEISSTGAGADSQSGGSGNNNSTTEVTNSSDHAFWATLKTNIAAIIQPLDAEPVGEGSSNPNILLNQESGIIGVRATQRQHIEVQNFIDEVLTSTRRQVLIEATIAEVKLSDSYQAGIDWALLDKDGGRATDFAQTITDINAFNRPNFAMSVTNMTVGGNLLQATLRALETFGDVSVMSSPKIMALNNQTALLKVVDNLIYFTLSVDIDKGEEGESDTIFYETRVNTLPVGFVMSVTPYISEHDSVTLNVRPTISRVIGHVRDPSPALAIVDVISEVPVVQVREVESVLKVSSGDIAVIGGLMQDDKDNNSRGIPILSKLPLIGSLFRYQDDNHDKTELVIFIKPKVIKHASIDGDMQEFKRFLPSKNEMQRSGQSGNEK